jgi:magnesium transporter
MSNQNPNNQRFHSLPSKKGRSLEAAQYTGHHDEVKLKIDVIAYNQTTMNEFPMSIGEFLAWKANPEMNYWVNITGINDVKAIKDICDKNDVHFLYQEDIVNIFQRPKLDEELDYIYLSFKELRYHDVNQKLEEEQYSILLFKNTILTFQETDGDSFDPVREKLKSNNSYYCEKGVDYLLYRFLDITIDNYFDILEHLGQKMEDLEDSITLKVNNGHQHAIQRSKKNTMQMRKNVYPVREIIFKLLNTENQIVAERTKKYCKDLYDHILQVIETVDNYREINVSLKDMYLNAQSHEMNKVIKVLTIISTFFIPLTFLVGVYGMNFDNMPELRMQYGYYGVWGVMICTVIGLSIWFKRKGWY